VRFPASGVRFPASGVRFPASGVRFPASGVRAGPGVPVGAGTRPAVLTAPLIRYDLVRTQVVLA
jgi:hypothetical protein